MQVVLCYRCQECKRRPSGAPMVFLCDVLPSMESQQTHARQGWDKCQIPNQRKWDSNMITLNVLKPRIHQCGLLYPAEISPGIEGKTGISLDRQNQEMCYPLISIKEMPNDSCVCMYECSHVCICVCVWMFTCVCIYVCVFMSRCRGQRSTLGVIYMKLFALFLRQRPVLSLSVKTVQLFHLNHTCNALSCPQRHTVSH